MVDKAHQQQFDGWVNEALAAEVIFFPADKRFCRIRRSVIMPDATLARLIMPTNHIAHFNNLSFIPYSSTSAIDQLITR